ncbi:hypothetical protein [Actinoplanes sp. NPDC051859]|uniref:5'-methylthioadenosine/S-adenosylhomocysteine nucleosidase family protein n=1 Tax=Actinoplanes sp. NPDC051859 TaxID=3363909 RepID=UPI0037A3F432
MTQLTFGECREAARSVRGAEMGAEVSEHLRPRITGLVRSQSPITMQIYRASREGRLIWHGPNSFAVLRPPADRPLETTSSVLRWIDRQWELVVLLGEFIIFVLWVLLLGGLRGSIGTMTLWYGAAFAELLLYAVIVTDWLIGWIRMTWRGLRSLAREAPRLDEIAAESLPYDQWSMLLCHHEQDSDAATLLNDVARRLIVLAGDEAPLACPNRGVTTSAMRNHVKEWAHDLPSGVETPMIGLRLPRRRTVWPSRLVETGAFFFAYAAGVAVSVTAMAIPVSDWEQSACTIGCADRPATFMTALEWVWHRLIWQNPAGLQAETFWARSLGFMIGGLLPATALVAMASIAQSRRYFQSRRTRYEAMMGEAANQARLLIVVATPVERDAVLRRARAGRTADFPLDFSARHPVYRLGVIGGVDVLLAQCGPGMTSTESAAYSLPELISDWTPNYVIMLGICFGLHEKEQQLGDVIVGTRLQVVNLRVGETDTIDRGYTVAAGHRLMAGFAVASPPPGARLWSGTLLSWDVLVDCTPLRAALNRWYQHALGGEMEGAAVSAASMRADVEWIVVKGISDWGYNKRDDAQQLAASNAAAVVFDTIEKGAFARREDASRSGIAQRPRY